MEALTVLFILVIVLILLGAAAAIGGVDSRDGFAADRRAERSLQLSMEWIGTQPVEGDEQFQLRTGLRSCHRTGP